jgi:hypothetical protein
MMIHQKIARKKPKCKNQTIENKEIFWREKTMKKETRKDNKILSPFTDMKTGSRKQATGLLIRFGDDEVLEWS